MGTIDMSQVAGFKAVDAEGNELGVVSMSELTASISEQVLQTIAMRNQANTLEQPGLMSAASTLAAGNDAYENELQQVSDANWVRALLADGTPVLWNKSDMASVLGELLKEKNFITRTQSIELPPRGSYETNGVGGLWIFTASYYTSSSIICNIGQSNGIQEINNLGTVFSKTDVEGKVCILRNGTKILIKNNTDIDYSKIRIAIVY